MPKLEATDSIVFGISIDSPAANNAFAEKIGVTFPLLSDMNRKVLKQYGILKMYNVSKDKNDKNADEYEWAQRTTFVVDKDGLIQHVEEEESAINPNNAVAVCTKLPKKSG
jgi:peroxiredoxin